MFDSSAANYKALSLTPFSDSVCNASDYLQLINDYITDIFSHVSSTPHQSGKKRKRYEYDKDYNPNKSFTEYYDAVLDDDTFFNETIAEYS